MRGVDDGKGRYPMHATFRNLPDIPRKAMRHPSEWIIALVGFLALVGMLSVNAFEQSRSVQTDQAADAPQERSQTAEQR
jgi:hypothetical protein